MSQIIVTELIPCIDHPGRPGGPSLPLNPGSPAGPGDPGYPLIPFSPFTHTHIIFTDSNPDYRLLAVVNDGWNE